MSREMDGITAAQLKALTLANQDRTIKFANYCKTICEKFARNGKSSVAFKLSVRSSGCGDRSSYAISYKFGKKRKFISDKVETLNGKIGWSDFDIDLDKFKLQFGPGFTIDNSQPEIIISWN